MSGRPINTDRQNAIDLGLRTYTGARHPACGTVIRYVSGGGCVHCARIIATEQRQARIFLKRQAEIDSRGDQGGDYPSSQDALDSPVIDGLDNDEPDARLEETDDDEARARFEESIDDLM